MGSVKIIMRGRIRTALCVRMVGIIEDNRVATLFAVLVKLLSVVDAVCETSL